MNITKNFEAFFLYLTHLIKHRILKLQLLIFFTIFYFYFDQFNWDFCLKIKIENADRTVYSYQLTKLIFVKIRNFQF